MDAGDDDDESLIVNYLESLEMKKIDYLVNTHPDSDHCGGLDA
ncbi:MAG: MBL fold metallo-hydrolase, partial [Clostridium sp.]|nr:MBL fold metallo-hydrolase [Clostridium sp.]